MSARGGFVPSFHQRGPVSTLQRLAVINANVSDRFHSLDADQVGNYCTLKRRRGSLST